MVHLKAGLVRILGGLPGSGVNGRGVVEHLAPLLPLRLEVHFQQGGGEKAAEMGPIWPLPFEGEGPLPVLARLGVLAKLAPRVRPVPVGIAEIEFTAIRKRFARGESLNCFAVRGQGFPDLALVAQGVAKVVVTARQGDARLQMTWHLGSNLLSPGDRITKDLR